MQSYSWKFYWVWPLIYSKNIPEVMFVAVIFIALLITLNCPCCPCNVELNLIRIAVLGTVYTCRSWPGNILTHAFINLFIHCFNMIGVIYVDGSLSVHFDKNRFLNWFGILKVIWNRTSGKNGTQPHRYGILTRIPGIQFVCLNATGSEACSAYMSSCQRQTWNP